MDDKKKKYVVPEALKVNFSEEDIITLSSGDLLGDVGEGDNLEDF